MFTTDQFLIDAYINQFLKNHFPVLEKTCNGIYKNILRICRLSLNLDI